MERDLVYSKINMLKNAMSNIIKGKEHIIDFSIISLLSKGHLLIEDIPGVGKTTLALALAVFSGSSFARIQFTSDLLPSDILGVSIFNQKTESFEFRYGPLFNNIVLADEINRTSPKTQSALLESMSESRVSIDGITYNLPDPFLVIATQNPVDQQGTFFLPDSQMDRFLMRISIGYPDRVSEKHIIKGINRYDFKNEKPVLKLDELHDMQKAVTNVTVSESLEEYILDLVEETRKNSNIQIGISPRGAQALYRSTQARALLNGRHYAIPDDVKKLIVPVFSHRIIPKGSLGMSSISEESVALMTEISKKIPIPK